jgi:hypothetical protein
MLGPSVLGPLGFCSVGVRPDSTCSEPYCRELSPQDTMDSMNQTLIIAGIKMRKGGHQMGNRSVIALMGYLIVWTAIPAHGVRQREIILLG